MLVEWKVLPVTCIVLLPIRCVFILSRELRVPVIQLPMQATFVTQIAGQAVPTAVFRVRAFRGIFLGLQPSPFKLYLHRRTQ